MQLFSYQSELRARPPPCASAQRTLVLEGGQNLDKRVFKSFFFLKFHLKEKRKRLHNDVLQYLPNLQKDLQMNWISDKKLHLSPLP